MVIGKILHFLLDIHKLRWNNSSRRQTAEKKFEYPQQWGIYLITDGYLYTEYYM